MNEKLPNQVEEFSAENCPNENLAKVAKFRTSPYDFLWPVYPIHTNSLFWVMFKELPFSSSKYLYSWYRLSNLVDLSFEYLSFSNKQKTTILFSSPLAFLQCSEFFVKVFFELFICNQWCLSLMCDSRKYPYLPRKGFFLETHNRPDLLQGLHRL